MLPIHEPTRRRVRTALVVFSHVILVGWTYRSTLRLAFVSDAWVYLGRMRGGVWSFLTTRTGYHYQPVACAWVALIRAVFGESAFAFQMVNLGQLALLALLTCQLGRRLIADAGAAFLASLLVIGSASFYEASYWPLAGNMHLLAAQFYVLAVIVAHDVACDRFGRLGPWLLALAVLAATFSHPAMVTSIPVCAWTIFVVRHGRHGNGYDAARTAVRRTLLPFSAVGILFALATIAFAVDADLGPRPSLDPMRAYWLVSRGLVAAFSLRGSDGVLHMLTTLGSNVAVPGRWIWAYVGGWLVVGIGGALIGAWRGRDPGVRVLSGLLALHVTILAVASPMSSRQGHVSAVAAGLLTAWALREASRRLTNYAGNANAAAVIRQIPAGVVILLILGARADHVVAAQVHAQAASVSRRLVEQVKALAPPGGPGVELTLVNMPGSLSDRGIHAAAFANGLHEQVRLTSISVAALELWRIPLPGAPEDFTNLSLPVDAQRLRERLLDPAAVVLLFEKDSGLGRLTGEPVTKKPLTRAARTVYSEIVMRAALAVRPGVRVRGPSSQRVLPEV